MKHSLLLVCLSLSLFSGIELVAGRSWMQQQQQRRDRFNAKKERKQNAVRKTQKEPDRPHVSKEIKK